MAPSGGVRDAEAPRVLSTTPEHRATVPGFADGVVFVFDETLSERNIIGNVLVSPETGVPHLDRKGNELHVSIAGGWQPNLVYRVVILPGIQDRFNNVRREPAEIVFSTGAPMIPTAIGGVVIDRLNERPLASMRVVAVGVRDTVAHATVTDTAGFFGLRFLPLSPYTITAYEDVNRNKKRDPNERFDVKTINIGTERDTIPLEFSLLRPDTLPARLLRADPRDSIEVRLVFDDYLDPTQPLSELSNEMYRMPDSTVVGTGRIVTVREMEEMRRVEANLRARAAADSARRVTARDTTRRDTAAVRIPPTLADPTRPPVAPPGVRADTTTRALPTQELVFLSPAPLEPGVRYIIHVRGVRNINGVPNGGGAAPLMLPRRPTTPATPPARRDTVPAYGRRAP